MNKTDLSRIKKRLTPDGHNPIVVRGVYLNSKKAVVSRVDTDLESLNLTHAERYTQLFKRAISGDIGKNLSLISFPLAEVMEGEKHARLMSLVREDLKNDEALDAFFLDAADSLKLEGNNLLLLMHDTYDTDYSSNRQEGDIETEREANVFKYLIFCVCPVKQAKAVLSYDFASSEFVTREPDWTVGAPSLGFMFPTFEDGGANISQALFYTKDLGADAGDFLGGVMNASGFTPVQENKERFNAVLMDALEEECSLDVVQSVNELLIDRLEESKKDRHSKEVRLSGGDIARVLAAGGVSDDKADVFVEKFNSEFGAGTQLPLAGITEDKRFEIKTPDVTVKVSPRQASQIETRVIDGVKYILIPADEGVTVNGISIEV
ncbi:MAG: DUF4317 family protein [Clostridia bacterium]|nr:DUF4317 family protein [Clostridia bacterium]